MLTIGFSLNLFILHRLRQLDVLLLLLAGGLHGAHASAAGLAGIATSGILSASKAHR